MFLILDSNWLENGWRTISFVIDLGIYSLIAGAYGLINELAGIAILSDKVFVNFTQRIYIVIGLFILFKTGLSLLSMLLNPDNFYDSKAGGVQLVKRIVIALSLLILIPTIFSNLFRFQYLILNEGILPSLILGSSDNMTSIVDTGESAGHVISGMTFRAFFTPNLKNSDGSINYGNSSAESIYTNSKAPIWSFGPLINATSNNQYVFRYSTVVSWIAGGFAAFLMISFAFEIALRSVKLAFLQLIAPVPIILSIDPKKGEALKAWFSEVTSTFVDLFMRLSLIYFAIFMIAEIFGGGIIPTIYRYNEQGLAVPGPISPLGAIFIIFGILMFVKIAPKLIYSMVGMKEPSGGLGLNPWKKLMGIPGVGKLAGATTSAIDAKMHGKRGSSGFKKGWDAVPAMGGTNTLKSLRSERTKALEAKDKKKDLDYDKKRGASFLEQRDGASQGRANEIEAQMIKDKMNEVNGPLDVKTLSDIKSNALDKANLELEGSFVKKVIFKGNESLSKAYDEVETMKSIKRGAESNYETLVKRIQSGERSPELIKEAEAARTNLTKSSVNLERAKSNYEVELNYNPSIASDMKAFEGAKSDAKLFTAVSGASGGNTTQNSSSGGPTFVNNTINQTNVTNNNVNNENKVELNKKIEVTSPEGNKIILNGTETESGIFIPNSSNKKIQNPKPIIKDTLKELLGDEITEDDLNILDDID
jgi:hypothetical protein